MPLTGSFPPSTPQSNFSLIPEGIYQVVIKDIEEVDSKKYSSDELEVKYLFKFVLLDGQPDIIYQSVNAFCSRSWFMGAGDLNPSKLVNIVTAIYGHYYPKIKITDIEKENVTSNMVNKLIGKQLRIVIKEISEKNKITDFLKADKILEFDEQIVTIPKIETVEDEGKPQLQPVLDQSVDATKAVEDMSEPTPNNDPIPF